MRSAISLSSISSNRRVLSPPGPSQRLTFMLLQLPPEGFDSRIQGFVLEPEVFVGVEPRLPRVDESAHQPFELVDVLFAHQAAGRKRPLPLRLSRRRLSRSSRS